MKKLLHIKRQESPDSESYYEDFIYEYSDITATVATALGTLPVEWEHSCLQKKCGACAMVINGRPCLACDTKLEDLKGENITIEPLNKFPVIRDLYVDRQSMMDKLKELSVWLDGKAQKKEEDRVYNASKCIMCGLCLEVCPNFYVGGDFGGMSAMAPMSRVIATADEKQKMKLYADYQKGIYEGCGKSLACRNICPAGVDIENLMVRNNASRLWNRRQ